MEMLVILAILGTLLFLLVPNIGSLLHKGRIKTAIADIAIISTRLNDHFLDYGSLPESLDQLNNVSLIDPWGHSYKYMVILGKGKNEISGKCRKDRFLVPLNSDFDLYSMGKDGKSVNPLTAKASHDDILRANNGDYIGLASEY
jgi:general secretion pathway protein G